MGTLPSSSKRRYPFEEKDSESWEKIPKIDSAVAKSLRRSFLPLEDLGVLKDPLDKKADGFLKHIWEAAAGGLKPAIAGTCTARALMVWLQHIEDQLRNKVPRNDVLANISLVQGAAAFLADSSIDSAKLTARAAGLSNAARRALWLKGCQGDLPSKHKLCSIPCDGQLLFGKKLDEILEQKPDGSLRTIINLRKLNHSIDNHSFKMESINTTTKLLFPHCFMAVIDLKEAYYHIPIHHGYDEAHTPQKLAWFWFHALEAWHGQAKQPLEVLRDEAEFLLLLEEFEKEASEESVKELYEAFLYSCSVVKENRREFPSPRFSEATISCLWGALSQHPRLVQSLIGFLLVADSHPASAEYNLYLLNITVTFLLRSLSSLQEEAAATSQTVSHIYSVLSTMHFSLELQAPELRRLCEELFNVCSDKGMFSEDRVQACLLRKQNYGLATLYGTLATEQIRTRIVSAKGEVQDLCDAERAVLSLFKEGPRPWKNIYFYSLCTGKHFLEQILLTAMAFFKKDFSSLNSLLSNELKPLRRLLVLLGWTHLQSTESAKSLLHVMHKNTDLCNDSLLKDFCDGLLYQVEALEWCIEHSRQEISRKDVLHHLCTLDSRSALYILHHLTNLPLLNEDEVLKLLRRGHPDEEGAAQYLAV
ncbi:zinc finger FYVE domain-containing protein 26-like [Ranitomeya imitator]|uniref:zinc finger FYVE domain-containing protein 26-like n=1 Tax=Ranitomeya imitator TaxID=111125 RepID=UPI0037E8F0A5